MSDPYDRSRRRGGFSHWVPLLVTVTIATAGVAAWAWSQRNRDDEDDYEDEDDHDNKNAGLALDYEHADYGENPPYGTAATRQRSDSNQLSDAPAAAAAAATAGWSSRMSDALSSTTGSPQQWVDTASKAMSAGMAAASAAVGGALASIREGDKAAYADHETWSEEADARKDRPSASTAAKSGPSRRRKTVVLVVSADSMPDSFDEDTFHEYASILSYIPRQNDFSRVRIFVLIYAPGLKETYLDPNSNAQAPSLSSSFSNIGADQAQSPKSQKTEEETVRGSTSRGNAAFHAVNVQALALVEKESDIIPFTTPSGHANILRLLEPDIVYVQESLTGENGSTVSQLQTWMRSDVVVVVGADNSGGGLADSESEAEKPGSDTVQKWWQREDRVGRGRGVVVVDGLRVNDDWIRRVQGQE